ncbi:hypothetical protein DSAG12_03841 [Promethearchaeum syntrophicum]|uniref:Uncharacterized protein n=1 Tax=Promethearchaeum syntrophicum TaxID=2594042 RepID=A0A5B9DGZ2_9ARCH|nr:hypothetical protein [Candidatus Prometheoarchaeum syntrophicum]QEE18003.1 hypothetical protein DSAG12_03841 [Candidatus Prometheoarchaeum syntrophicum]
MKELKKTKIIGFFGYIFSFLFHSHPVVIVANAGLPKKKEKKDASEKK